MKKYFPNAHLLTLIFGAVAIALRFWMLSGGTDQRDLYPRFHIAWLLVCLLTVAVLVFLLFLTRHTDSKRPYKANFPASSLGAAGHLAAAVAVAVTVVQQWPAGTDGLTRVINIAGILSAFCLAFSGYLRLKGMKPPFYLHISICFYCAVRSFAMARDLGNEPELCRYLFPILASLSTLVASYQLWGFDVDMGNRRKSLFWSLSAAYLSMAAIPGSDRWLLYAGLSLWLITNLCSLQPFRRPRPAAPAEASPETSPIDLDPTLLSPAEDPE